MFPLSGTNSWRKATTPKYLRPICKGPIAVRNLELAVQRHSQSEGRRGDSGAHAGALEGFMNAASPGTIAVFQPNEYYATYHEISGSAGERHASRVRND